MPPANRETINQVKKIFAAFLEQKAQRKTSERFAILEAIYSRDDHFNVDNLYVQMKNQKFNVSRATVYNTIELLISCDLVVKHQFGKNLAYYEKSYGYKQHDHIICVECKKVVEFCDPRIQQIQSMMGDLLNFKITHHSLNLYGICGQCQKKVVVEENKNKVNIIIKKVS